MLKRDITQTLLNLSSQFPVVCITGPRQSGKTTLSQLVFPEKKYITFDDKIIREIATQNPKDFLMSFPDGAIIDEAQKVPDIFDALKMDVDKSFKPGKFILNGSSQFRLKKNMSDSLAGRAAFIKLLPFSVNELKEQEGVLSNPYDFILRGQFPPLHDKNKSFSTFDWYENYIETFIEQDVSEQINQQNLSNFKKFVQICAVYSGKLLSMEHISNDIGVSAVTIKSWLSILENSFLIYFLEPDINNLGRKLVHTPKLYFTDSGLLSHLLRINTREDLLLSQYKGAIVESFAISELIKQRLNVGRKPDISFYRDKSGLEVDVIANWEKLYAIEIKSSSASETKLSSNLRRYKELHTNTEVNNTVFYLGDFNLTVNETKYVTWTDWGNLQNNG